MAVLRLTPDIPLSVPDTLKLDSFLGRGRQPGERELDVANNTPQFNAEALASLQGMGFPILRCQKALLATGNRDAEGAMNWLFQHMDDPGAYRSGSSGY
jgi:ubiquitin carboxyl-terminal hydrolase 5/13